jgi:23S rRNA pseudouridine2605 synthase
MTPIRIAKLISDRGYCSRRNAEELISQGVVFVNGDLVESPAQKFLEDVQIVIEGKNLPLNHAQPRLWLYYKPVGFITTHYDPQNRPTVFDNLPIKLDKKIISVGRLDINSEGLLLLTDNGEVARHFELPSNNLERKYKIRAFGEVSQEMLSEIARGVTIDAIRYKPAKIKVLSTSNTRNKKNHWFEITLTEGKNREIRRIFSYFDFEVNRLIRTSYGAYELGDLTPGEMVETQLL